MNYEILGEVKGGGGSEAVLTVRLEFFGVISIT
jgi:hypothetical protein